MVNHESESNTAGTGDRFSIILRHRVVQTENKTDIGREKERRRERQRVTARETGMAVRIYLVIEKEKTGERGERVIYRQARTVSWRKKRERQTDRDSDRDRSKRIL